MVEARRLRSDTLFDELEDTPTLNPPRVDNHPRGDHHQLVTVRVPDVGL